MTAIRDQKPPHVHDVPGIVYDPVTRRARVAGMGLEVWEVVNGYRSVTLISSPRKSPRTTRPKIISWVGCPRRPISLPAMKFHLDEDGSQVVTALGRERHSLDSSSSHELGLEGMTDSELLRWCSLQERCVVTKNGKDFTRLTYQFEREGLPHAGVLVIPRSIGNDEFVRIARAVAWFDEMHREGVPSYFVDYLHDPPDDWPGSM